jgi:hypothetical protein
MPALNHPRPYAVVEASRRAFGEARRPLTAHDDHHHPEIPNFSKRGATAKYLCTVWSVKNLLWVMTAGSDLPSGERQSVYIALFSRSSHVLLLDLQNILVWIEQLRSHPPQAPA